MKEKKYNTIAVLDTVEDKLISQSLELISFAENFNNGDLSRILLVIPGKNIIKLCESITEKYGIDTVVLEHVDFYLPNPELLAQKLSRILDKFNTELLLFSHTVRNCQTASKISVSKGIASVTAVDSYRREMDYTVFQRSIFNGKLKLNVRVNSDVKIATILPGAYTLLESKTSNDGNPGYLHIISEIIREDQPDEVSRYKPLSLSSETESDVKLEDADVIVSAGRGIGKEENLHLIRETASIFDNAAIVASRPVCDQRWLPFNQQVGITGKTVSPKLYLACGISGSQQHIAGMKNSQIIAAINKDPNAAIFAVADYIIVEDLVTFLPVLVKKYRERYGD